MQEKAIIDDVRLGREPPRQVFSMMSYVFLLSLQNIVPLGTLPTAMQEQAIIDDVLCCMEVP